MSEIVINPDIKDLQTNEPARFDIYQQLFEGMKKANEGTPPDYSQAPYSKPQLDAEGNEIKWIDADGNAVTLTEPQQSVIEAKMAEITEIQMKNSAYLFAKVIDTAATTATSGIDLTKLVQKSGDTMTGLLGALHGFEAGYNTQKIFDVIINAANENVAHVYGNLNVDNDLAVAGALLMSDTGIYFSKHQSIFYKDNALQFDSQNIKFTGDIKVDGTFTLGSVVINSQGIFWGSKEFYHSGNSNLPTVDWEMYNAHVYGDLTVDGAIDFNGRLKALKGFDLGEGGKKMFYSVHDDASGLDYIVLASDIDIVANHGIKFDGQYIIKVRGGSDNIVSFAAPGKIMNLGDSDGNTATQFISLQSNIKTSDHQDVIISHLGDGYFRNSLRAGYGAGDALITYYHSPDDCGVMFPKMIAVGNEYGPKLYSKDIYDSLWLSLPYLKSNIDGTSSRLILDGMTYAAPSNSLFHDQTLEDISQTFETKGEFFVFKKPITANKFFILGERYKTRLQENALFFDDGTFIEGVPGGMAFTGNAYFNNDVGTEKFASGFAGYGWGVHQNETSLSWVGTLDELVVRKKMRIYELEVQKISATNGSLWVTDSCSGDAVEVVD